MKRFLHVLALSLTILLACTVPMVCMACGKPAELPTYEITFNCHGGLPAFTTKKVTQGETVSPITVEKENCRFVGWYQDAGYTREFNFETPIYHDYELHAKWVELFTVNFDINNGDSTEPEPQIVEDGANAEQPVEPTRAGYYFDGWYEDLDSNEPFDFNTPIQSATTLHAKWTILRTVTFVDSATNQTVSTQAVADNGYVNQPSYPTRTGYTCAGWYDENGNAFVFWNTAITANITLTAKWNLTVTFNTGIGTSIDSQSLITGQTATQPNTEPTSVSHNFAGWYSDEDCTQTYDFNQPLSEHTTIYAKWTLKEYQVTFDVNGGAGNNQTRTVQHGATVQIDDPIRECCDFLGWYEDLNDVEPVNLATRTITGPLTLYAKWFEIYTFALVDGGLNYQIKSYNTKSDATKTSLTLPATYQGRDVVSIGASAFENSTKLTAVEMPDSITTIGYKTFNGCSNLMSIEIPNSVISFGNNVFNDCTELTSVNYLGTLDDWAQINFSNIYSNPLYYAHKLKINGEEITNGILATATKINSFAFYNCTSLTGVEISASLTSIGQYAFYKCSSLTSVKIPSGVTSIGQFAFCNCSSLTSVKIPSGVTSTGYGAFSECSSLISVEIPSSVTSISEYSFSGCISLTNIEIPGSVTSIGNAAFSECSSLISIEIPASVTSIVNNPFRGCGGLTSIIVDEHNTVYTSRDENNHNINAIIRILDHTLITGCQNTIIPNTVTGIGLDAFCKCYGLTSIIISINISSVELNAFYEWTSTQTIYIEAVSRPGGWSSDWRNMCKAVILWGNQWHYDDNGNPVPNE